ncbi:2-oxoglutarate and iron-dependent oxygenase domain-containing protein 3 isoform X1 [Pan troglodytes]|uniref:2-oxoglutarate and iron-dependent oxygenase domain-containing protein 3 isoform X1 n=1 Tax=Pan troglodytes TaxID=9598 RepID=UPI000D09CD3E|nr:2-oxoglutarate and iron-dependent oxygenase domain-containing protein 3 isoform X1 [Pan troglodytes]
MAPQRRAASKAPEGNGAAERRNRSSTKKDRAPREVQRLWQRPWLRTAGLGAGLVLTALLLWSSLGADDGVAEVLARRGEVVAGRFIEVPCSEDYDSHRRFEGCTPRKCGRGVTDVVITREEAERIRSIAEKGLSLGGSDGGASILDLHSGALSVGKHFVNLYRYFGDKMQNIFSEEDFRLYREVRQKVQLTIAEAFGISASSLHLTKPTFFSRINSTEARTAHDEYWHAHVDKCREQPAPPLCRNHFNHFLFHDCTALTGLPPAQTADSPWSGRSRLLPWPPTEFCLLIRKPKWRLKISVFLISRDFTSVKQNCLETWVIFVLFCGELFCYDFWPVYFILNLVLNKSCIKI